MTDAVNAPQEMIDAVMKVPVGLDEYGAEVFPGPFAAAELVRAMLAATPKAVNVPDPASMDDAPAWYTYEEASGWVCGWMACRDAMLAAAPKADGMDAYTRPDTIDAITAPKVEQEPVAKVVDFGDTVEVIWHTSIPPHNTSLYTHPAPASDARVISYEEAHATAAEMGYPSLTDALEDLERLQKDRDAFDGLGDSAPASDELLEVVKHQEKLLRAICDAPQPKHVVGHLYNAIHDVNCYVAGLNAQRLAKHKGPQS